MRREYEETEENIDEEVEEDDDDDYNSESLFTSRPDDVELVEEYADAFVNEGGVETKKEAYGYALDAYLEGLGEFWASVENVNDDDEQEEAEEDNEDDEDDDEDEENDNDVEQDFDSVRDMLRS